MCDVFEGQGLCFLFSLGKQKSHNYKVFKRETSGEFEKCYSEYMDHTDRFFCTLLGPLGKTGLDTIF